MVDQAVAEDALLSYDTSAHFSDDDTIHGDSLTYSATLQNGDPLPSWLSINATTGELSGTPLNAHVGTILVTVTADDGEATINDTLQIDVTNTNDAPIVSTPLVDQAVAEDALLSYDTSAHFSDDDTIHGDSLTYSATLQNGDPLPSWLSINATTGELSGTPLNAHVGTILVTVTADDGEASINDTLQIDVTNTNDAPTVTSIANTNTDEGDPFSYDVSGAFGDVDIIHGDSLTFSFVGSPPAWLSINATTGEITGTPGVGDVGVSTITVRVTDGSAETAQTSFDLTVDDINQAPTVLLPLPDTGVTEDMPVNVDISPFFDDPDGDTLTFTATLDNGDPLPGWLSFSSDGTFSGTPLNDDVGVINVKVIADDGNGETVEDIFQLTINNFNDAPEATSAQLHTSVNANVTLNHDVSSLFTDDDTIHGDTLSYSLDSAPAWVSIDPNTGIVSGILNSSDPNDMDVTEIVIRATDDQGASITNTFFLTIKLNDTSAPEATLNLTSGTSGSEVIQGSTASETFSGDTLGSISGTAVGGADTIYGDAGDDIISGDSSSSIFDSAQGGDDTLDGGAGNDYVYGDAALDMLGNATGGNDIIYGGDGLNKLIGDAGGEMLGGAVGGNDTMYGGSDVDAFYGDAVRSLSGNAQGGDDIMYGYGGNDVFYGDAGIDMIDNAVGGNDTMYGGAGADTMYGDSDDDMLGTAVGGNDTIYGGDDNDLIIGDAGGLMSSGSAQGGDDFLYGDAGNDTLHGDAYLTGNAFGGDDYLEGGAGFDSMYGGSGNDTLNFDLSDIWVDGDDGFDTAQYDAAGNVAIIRLHEMEKLDIENTQVNTLTINDGDIIGVTDGDNELYIDGDATDTITLGAGWTDDQSTVDYGGKTYNVYTSTSGESLYIENDVTPTLPSNNAPVVTAPISNMTVVGGDPLNYDVSGSFSDPDVGDTLTYTLEPGAPAWLSINSSTGILSGNPTGGDIGAPSVTVRATDSSSGAWVTDTFYITVKNTSQEVYGEGGGGDLYDVIAGSEEFQGDANAEDISGDGFAILTGNTQGGDDIVYAGGGDDYIQGDAKGLMEGNSVGGDDALHGEAGADYIYGDSDAQLQGNAVGGDDIIYGGADNDWIVGDSGHDMLGASFGGGDILYGDAGNDVIIGDAQLKLKESSQGGDDFLYGGDGTDSLYGDAYIHDENGQGGDDYLEGGAGADYLRGQSGNDTLNFDNEDQSVHGGTGFDTAQFDAGGSVDLSNLREIEFLDLENAQANTLTINDGDLLIPSNNELYLDGDVSDTITLGTGWTDDASTVDYGGKTYDVYTSTSGETLYLENEITPVFE